MAPMERGNIELEERERELFHLLDKGMDDVENNRIIPHDKAMKMIREKLQIYEV